MAMARGPPGAIHRVRPNDERRASEMHLPTWDEFKGSTVIVTVSIVLLGGFTVAVDFVFSLLVRYIT